MTLPHDLRHDAERANLPFSVSCDLPQPLLFELADGRFQLIDRTPPSPFMAGPRYLLVEQALADFLRELALERVRFEPAVLFDRATGVEHRDHVRVRIGQFFTHDQIHDLAVDGCRLMTLNEEYCFASDALVSRLRAAGFPYLRFSLGLSQFG